MTTRHLARGLALLSLLTIAATAAQAAGNPGPAAVVDVELVLAGDVSGSMTRHELQVQRDGLVAAFRGPEVLEAIRSGALGRIAVTYIEWAGPKTSPIPRR